jgi:putative ABC transport system permease protein
MRLYRALLHLYPAGFRAEYEDELCAVFEDRRRDASNLLAVITLWLAVLLDTLISAAQVQWDVLRQDLGYALRTLARSPGFALTAILVTAIGIGANTAAFSLIDHALIRPLPFPDSDRLAKLWEDQSSFGYREMDVSPANYRDWRRMNTVFEQMGAYSGLSADMVGQGRPERLTGYSFTAAILPMLSGEPALGRIFTPADTRDGAPGTVLLSHGLWMRRFGGDPGVLGRKILLDGVPFVIIGVMPGDFCFPSRETELWTATRFAPDDFEDRTNDYLRVLAKLKPGVSLAQARAAMKVVGAEIERRHPKQNAHVGVTVDDLRDEVSEGARLMYQALFGAAFCVLLIACTNLANLLLARALARRKELAVRAAMGAGRERLVRQLLTESLLLAVCGGVLGVLIATRSMPLLIRLVPPQLPIGGVPVDGRVLVFATVLILLTGIGFGMMPALRAGGVTRLREGSRSGVGGRRERLRGALVIVEVTASVVLLISSGLLIRALWRVRQVDPGFRAEGVLTLRTALPMPKYEKLAVREQFYARVLSGVDTLPGVEGAAYISFLPMSDVTGGIWQVAVPGRTNLRAHADYASLRYVTPGFFRVMRIPLLAGRDLSDGDTRDKAFVAVVSESFARRYWPGGNAIGRHFRMAFSDRRIVGVVGNIRVRGLDRSSEPQVYLPYLQVGDGDLVWYAPKDLAIRASGDVRGLLPAVREVIRNADPDQPISNVATLAGLVDADSAWRVLVIRVLGSFAAVAFLLAAIGIHGLLSFNVSTRAQEIGVRMALGAQPRNILAMTLREGIALAALGAALGAILAYGAGRTLQSLLVGVRPDDLATFMAAIGLVLVMTVGGSLLPAMKAVRIDPASTIRAE